MLQLNKYQVYIFDCDGVILDSNQLKIEAMKNALEAHFSNSALVDECISYFRRNFGKSRFHHVAHFLDSVFVIPYEQKAQYEESILADFSRQCRTLYLSAELTPGVVSFIERCHGKKYVASGSEQDELRDIFVKRSLDKYFDGVFGSPTRKSEIIKHILQVENSNNAVMIGDAESDMESAIKNKIDFVFYAPYSNVKSKMLELCKLSEHLVIEDFSTVRVK